MFEIQFFWHPVLFHKKLLSLDCLLGSGSIFQRISLYHNPLLSFLQYSFDLAHDLRPFIPFLTLIYVGYTILMDKHLFRFFDRLEDTIRIALSRRPIVYAFVGGTAIVLFWRGVWMVADTIPFLTGPISIFLSVVVLLGVGLFVSFFIGDNIIISGIKKEKKLDEKIASEIKTELDILQDIEKRLDTIEKELKTLKRMKK